MEEIENLPKESGSATSPGSNLIPGAIVVAGLLIAGSVIYSNSQNKPMAVSSSGPAAVGALTGQPPENLLPQDLTDNDPMLGNPEAPVTLVEFGDFQCPFCGRFFKTVEPQLIEKYVKTGKVRFVYRDFAFLGPESEWAAEAAECAKEQEKFWPYHDYLYNNQQGENMGAFSKANLKQFARRLGLDPNQFDTCLDTNKYTAEVQKDTEDGRKAGVNGTPTSFVNGRTVTGAVPWPQLETVIEEELKKAR